MVEVIEFGQYVYAIESYNRPISRQKAMCEFILAYNKRHSRVPPIMTTARAVGIENWGVAKRFYEFLKSEGYIYVPKNKEGNSIALHVMKNESGLRKYANILT